MPGISQISPGLDVTAHQCLVVHPHVHHGRRPERHVRSRSTRRACPRPTVTGRRRRRMPARRRASTAQAPCGGSSTPDRLASTARRSASALTAGERGGPPRPGSAWRRTAPHRRRRSSCAGSDHDGSVRRSRCWSGRPPSTRRHRNLSTFSGCFSAASTSSRSASGWRMAAPAISLTWVSDSSPVAHGLIGGREGSAAAGRPRGR